MQTTIYFTLGEKGSYMGVLLYNLHVKKFTRISHW